MQVAGLAVVSVVCFTSSASVALLTDIPVRLLGHRPSTIPLIAFLILACILPF